jgi:predicted nucleotidyltransferase
VSDGVGAETYDGEVTTGTDALQRLDEAVAAGSIDELCVHRRVRLLAVVGSAARGTAVPGSDLDLAVEWLAYPTYIAQRSAYVLAQQTDAP